jgi:NADH:ubiquinone oxidoreductase subunit F (NADH-binding)
MSLPRLLAGVRADRPLSLAEHEAIHGPMPPAGPGLAEDIAASGLRGRGGASFPTAVKLRSVAARRGPRTVLVNGAEGEPMSAKDRILLRSAPQLVLDGALAAAEAIGARSVVVAVPSDAPRALDALHAAVAERGVSRRVSVTPVAVAYLAGEETALIRYLDGARLKPATAPPLPHERGLRRRPTLVQNPETLAHLALILRHGPDWFREEGTHGHPGSSLVTVCGAVAAPGVQEISLGAPMDAVLGRAGGTTDELRAVLVGGFHGTWIPAHALPSVTLDDEGLAWHGGSLAAGVIVALGRAACPVQEVAQTLAWLEGQSAHQCGPCSNGLPAIAGELASVAAGRDDGRGLARVERWSGLVVRRGACRLPDGAVRFLRSALEVFAAEFADHARRGPCGACARPLTLTGARSGVRGAAA